MGRFLFLLGILAVLAACAGTDTRGRKLFEEPFTNVNVPFDPDAVRYVNRPGTARISGLVALSTPNGPIIGDYANIRLVPIADYSEAVMEFYFQGEKAYFHGRQIDNLDRRYNQFMRYGRSDDAGHYELIGVPAGTYFVYGAMVDHDKKIYFGVYERLRVEEGRSYVVDLDGV